MPDPIPGSSLPEAPSITHSDYVIGIVGGEMKRASVATLFEDGLHGAIYDVVAYGADPTGVADSTPAFVAAVAAAVLGRKGIVYIPPGTYRLGSTWTIGDGTSTTISTYAGITILGAGGQRHNNVNVPSATTLLWDGPSNGTVIKFAGPIGGLTMANFHIECNDVAGIALQIMHAPHAHIQNVSGWNYNIAGFDIDSHGVASFNGGTELSNVYGDRGLIQGFSLLSVRPNAVGIRLGKTGTTAGWSFIGGSISMGGSTGTAAIEARDTDHCTFVNVIGTAAQGIRVKPRTGVGGTPHGLVFLSGSYNGSTGANAVVIDESDQAWSPSTQFSGLYFQPFATADGASIPNDPRIRGVSDTGIYFGFHSVSLKSALIASSSAIANTTTETAFSKTITLAAKQLNVAGAVLRIRAAGRYSTTGTPSLVLRARIGGLTVADPVMATANNASNYQWSFEATLTIRAPGASGTAQRGANYGGAGGGGLSIGASSGTFTLDTVSAQVIDVTAQWGTASSSNTIVLDVLEVDVFYAGATVS